MNDAASATDFSPSFVKELYLSARGFHANFLTLAEDLPSGLHISRLPDWGPKLIRRSGTIPKAIVEKIGSNSVAKRRPKDTAPFLAFLEKRFAAAAPLNFRVVVGPVKNVPRFGIAQRPDLAEYLMLMQLARVMQMMAALYPYGVTVQMVPDDKRGQFANNWPAGFAKLYIGGLRQLVADLHFSHWLTVEEGQSRLYAEYDVLSYEHAAREAILNDPQCENNLAAASLKAAENLAVHGEKHPLGREVREAALRYLIAHKAELLSGMWSPQDAFPLIYAHHPESYQLFTLGRGITKLPWQISLLYPASDAHVAPARQFATA